MYNPITTYYAMWHVSIDQCGDIMGCLSNETSNAYYLFHWLNMVTNKFYLKRSRNQCGCW
jgi:hypothetical protein